MALVRVPDYAPPRRRVSFENAARDMAGAEGFMRYLAEIDGDPAGGASMRTPPAVTGPW